jgi:hypothetical protein
VRDNTRMKTTASWSRWAARVLIAGCAIASVGACKGKAATGFGADDDAGGASDDASPSSGSSSDGGAAGNVACGTQGACSSSEDCCYAAAGDAAAGGGLGGFAAAQPPAPTCVPKGSCGGSSLSCSSTAQCGGGQVCCFAYQTQTSGAGEGGLAAFGGFAAMMPFSAQCASDCPSGDMVHYQLCASASECPSGMSCVQGTYTTYCAAGVGGGAGQAGPRESDSGAD